jgi:hypothetical protein
MVHVRLRSEEVGLMAYAQAGSLAVLLARHGISLVQIDGIGRVDGMDGPRLLKLGKVESAAQV